MLVACDGMIVWCHVAFLPYLRLLRQTVEVHNYGSLVNRKPKSLGRFFVFFVENAGWFRSVARVSIHICRRYRHRGQGNKTTEKSTSRLPVSVAFWQPREKRQKKQTRQPTFGYRFTSVLVGQANFIQVLRSMTHHCTTCQVCIIRREVRGLRRQMMHDILMS